MKFYASGSMNWVTHSQPLRKPMTSSRLHRHEEQMSFFLSFHLSSSVLKQKKVPVFSRRSLQDIHLRVCKMEWLTLQTGVRGQWWRREELEGGDCVVCHQVCPCRGGHLLLFFSPVSSKVRFWQTKSDSDHVDGWKQKERQKGKERCNGLVLVTH